MGESANPRVDAVVVTVITEVSIHRTELIYSQWHLYAANMYELKLGCGGVY